jgi:heme exporter protein C
MRIYLYLTALYLIVMLGMYRALLVLGPLDPSFLRYDGDPLQEGYRIFFFAMQNAPVVYLAFLVVLIGSIAYLKTRDSKWDILASSSAKIGIVFTTILLISGAIFSNLAWGAYWNWDPRQTTSLFLWFILAAYLTLRSALEDPETRARMSAVLGIFGFAGVPLTHISATIWVSNHPQIYNRASGAGFSLGREELITFALMVIGAIMLYAYLTWLTVRIKNLKRLKNEGL